LLSDTNALHCVMKKNQEQDVGPQGVDMSKIDLDQVKKWLRHDIGVAIGCLNAIQSDQAIMDQIAVFMLGRMKNQLNNPNQLDAFKKENSTH